MNAFPKLSQASKMPCKSWSLQAIDTCPGSVDKSRPSGLVEACEGCYATEGNYVFPNVKAVRAHNQQDWQNPDWVDAMVAAIGQDQYFRWFDSGDVYSLELAEKMYAIMVATPTVKHWLPTRMAKFLKFQAILAKMQALPNVMVRFSSDAIDGTFTSKHGSTILPATATVPAGVTLCRAYERGGKCESCRACYDKSVAVIGYPAHGKKMGKVIRLAVAA